MYAYAQSKVEICGVNTAKLQTLKNDEILAIPRTLGR